MLRLADLSMLAGGPPAGSSSVSELEWADVVPFHSLCEQHLLPFYGVARVGYLPGDAELNESELARIVEACSRGIQIQQRMTTRIGLWLYHQLAPRGVGVVVEAVHICMPPSRVSSVGAQTLTTAFYGSLRDSADAQREFLAFAGHQQAPTQEVG